MAVISIALLLALPHLALVFGFRQGEVVTPVVHDTITFEAWSDSELVPQNVLMALDTTANPCSSGPLKVLVRISSCFAASDFAAIDSWAGSSLATLSPIYYVNGTAVRVQYYARLENPTTVAGCGSGAVLANATTFKNAISAMVYDDPASPIASPDAIITFVKENGELSAITAGYKLQFRLCSWSCTVLETDKVLSSLSDLSTYSPTSISRYVPCSRIGGAVAVPYKDASGTSQCVCACPTGTALDSGACKSTGAAHGGTCPWNTNNAGYKCAWSSRDMATLKLVTDCHIAVPVPKDNYVSDDRVNRNDSDAVATGPSVVVTSVSPNGAITSLTDTWRQYVKQPDVELNKLGLPSFGIYNLTITASDYRSNASCGGCVAVVDAFAPHALLSCGTIGWGATNSTPADLNSTSLQAAIDKEANFTAFSSTGNVVNNGVSERMDLKNRTMRDWYATSFTDLSNDTVPCFHSLVLRDLLSNSLSTQNPLATMDSTALAALQCSRCCAKQTTLREYYYDYKCSTAMSSDDKLVNGSETCSFNHCMRILPTALVDVKVTTTSGTSTITRNSSCSVLSAACSEKAIASSLVNLSSTWTATLPNDSNYLVNFDATRFVFWRFKLGSNGWTLWNSTAELEFTNASTSLTLQAWTRCGLVSESTLTVVVTVKQTSPYVVKTSETTPTYTVNDYIQSLVPLAPRCGTNEVLKGFRLLSDSGNNARYWIACLASSALSTVTNKATAWVIGKAKMDTSYLASNDMDCGTSAISRFQLDIANNNSVRYNYSCTAATPTPTQCVVFTTAKTDRGNGTAYFLDRQNVTCPDDWYLSQAVLQYEANKNDVGTNWYKYTCCQYRFVQTTRTSSATTLTSDVKSLAPLAANCLSGEAMRSVKLVSTNGANAYYSAACIADTQFSAGIQTATNWTTGSTALYYLAGHDINCGTSAINGFQLVSQGNDIRYSYSCTDATVSSCSVLTTTATNRVDDAAYRIDQHNMTCGTGGFLARAQLQYTATTFWYKYSCCTPT